MPVFRKSSSMISIPQESKSPLSQTSVEIEDPVNISFGNKEIIRVLKETKGKFLTLEQ